MEKAGEGEKVGARESGLPTPPPQLAFVGFPLQRSFVRLAQSFPARIWGRLSISCKSWEVKKLPPPNPPPAQPDNETLPVRASNLWVGGWVRGGGLWLLLGPTKPTQTSV